jgi:hypothetical protein
VARASEERIVRSPARARLVRVFFVAVLVGQAFLILRAYHDPHKLFGFQPFNESDTWSAEIVRVTEDGRRLPVDDGTWAYDWNDLVDVPQISGPPHRQVHASAGAAGVIDFLDRALDWVILHTPLDPGTVRLEATVTWYRDTDGPRTTHLVGAERPAP